MRRGFKYFAQLAILSSFLIPSLAFAACSDSGLTVVFINGIRDSDQLAGQDNDALAYKIGGSLNGQRITYKTAYNGSHLAGIGDFIETEFPKADDFDLRTILIEMHDEVHTRKMLIVGHSQGAVYANKVYEYLIQHGEPAASVAVYAVATPDSYVAGGGHYLTYTLDDDINIWAKVAGLNPLPPNVQFADVEYSAHTTPDTIHGHGFIDTYLNFFPNRITSDINTELWLLRSEPSTVTDGCFEPPTPDPLYSMQKGALTVADPIATGVKIGLVKSYQVAAAVIGTSGNLLAAVGGFFGSFGSSPQQAAKNDQGASDATIGLLHASNLTTLTPKVNEELRKPGVEDLGAAAVLAVLPGKKATTTATTINQGEVLGVATDTLPIATTTPAASSTTPELLVPIPHPNPAVGLVSHSDGQGASPSAAPVDNTVATSSPTTTPTFGAPQNIVLSNWHSEDLSSQYARNQTDYCGLATPALDVAWNAVPNATAYYLWQQSGAVETLLRTTFTPNATDVPFEYDANSADQQVLEVVAADGAGNFATSSVALSTLNPHEEPLLVESTMPAWGSRNVDIHTPIQIIYNHAINPASLTPSSRVFARTFMAGGANLLDATWSLESDGRTVDVVPTDLLLPESDYVAVVQCGVEDLFGNHGNSLAGPVTSPQFITSQ